MFLLVKIFFASKSVMPKMVLECPELKKNITTIPMSLLSWLTCYRAFIKLSFISKPSFNFPPQPKHGCSNVYRSVQ